MGWVSTELAVFQVLASGRVQNRKGNGGKRVSSIPWRRHDDLGLSQCSKAVGLGSGARRDRGLRKGRLGGAAAPGGDKGPV